MKLCRRIWVAVAVAALAVLLAVGASAVETSKMPENWQDVRVNVGGVTLPLEEYPDGATFSSSKSSMTAVEMARYGISSYPTNKNGAFDLYGTQCVGFARYVYTALFYKYQGNSTMDMHIAYDDYAAAWAYKNMIRQTLGISTLSAGYTADTLRILISSCEPGAVMRVTGHSMVIMAIYSDGFLVYDGNFSGGAQVDVRAYTWESFVSTFGGKAIEAVHMPTNYPGYTMISGGSSGALESGEYYVTNLHTYLNVREAPNASSKSVGKLYNGDIVTVVTSKVNESGDYWAEIFYNEAYCWIKASYLAKAGSVVFDATGGNVEPAFMNLAAGPVPELPLPTKTNRSFLGWYTADGKLVSKGSSWTATGGSVTLYAKWGAFSFTDVADGDWFCDYTYVGVANGVFSDDKLFHPLRNITRAETVTILGRLYDIYYDVDTAGKNTKFQDVASGGYYEPYVAWGTTIGVVQGTSSTTFSPSLDVTREQIATMVYRMMIHAGKAATDGSDVNMASTDTFSDGAQISDYAKTAMCWAVQHGVFKGNSDGGLHPKSNATRAETAAVVVRIMSMM